MANAMIGNAATSVGPLYVWRNIAKRMDGMYHPEGDPRRGPRGPFIKAGSNHPQANGGRAYYFYNSAPGAGNGIARSGGRLYNFVARNNDWPASRVDPKDGPYELDQGRRGAAIPNFTGAAPSRPRGVDEMAQGAR